MNLALSHIIAITGAETKGQITDAVIREIVTDSRKITGAGQTIYAAIKGVHHNGHLFLRDCYDKGIRFFIVEENTTDSFPDDAVFLRVKNTVDAIQRIASAHRSSFKYPVIGITGSNGKTIVKEWLNQLLCSHFKIVRSPKSYNSQVGVPFSIWNMGTEHSLGIFEAGISMPGEMEKLERIIRPEIGVLTTIGQAHIEHFSSRENLIREKIILFGNSRKIIYCSDAKDADAILKAEYPESRLFSWSLHSSPGSDLYVTDIIRTDSSTSFTFQYADREYQAEIPFGDQASLENAVSCISVCLVLNISPEEISDSLKKLNPVRLRLQLIRGAGNFDMINDSYSADLKSLEIALEYMARHARERKTAVVLSDILQSGETESELHAKINSLLQKFKTEQLFGIGTSMIRNKAQYEIPVQMFPKTEDFLRVAKNDLFQDHILLVKGAREFGFERIVANLQAQTHETVLEVDLNAVARNMHYFRRLIGSETKLMVMVKAAGYGTGTAEIARTLEFNKADYLAVAYIDEGIALREAGISLPIMVLNSELAGLPSMIRYQLEPEIFSLKSLDAFVETLKRHPEKQPFPVHIKLDTGMHRLGFETEEIERLCDRIAREKSIRVVSIFTHLAGSDDPGHDAFTHHQLELFRENAERIISAIGYRPMLHAANTGAIQRHPESAMDMVRLGIGLYGISADPKAQGELQTVATLKTIISQIKNIRKGESIGYGRNFIAVRNMRIATIPVGYADGLKRSLSNGKGAVMINGHLCPIVGNVCMDMTMVDITDADVSESDSVEIFGNNYPIAEIARNSGTIAYEVLTSISHRVKRIYLEE